ncbi:hypothetical protein SAMN02745824_0857 [Parasphingorhabdus marina DSM 22363]|uniref:Uncharacterized protein n=1 Tax=Parasphingorhabdus marina DSM 22363 TaxID=1123272 RepID=A0A1N6CS04_9SPHN|nr:hypothetical protein [Parasphingorhabdus marina]SIN61312.1 hypothetical protein SAMN02745824_0857 [Parasphingorhabdus marina DSM 22363]
MLLDETSLAVQGDIFSGEPTTACSAPGPAPVQPEAGTFGIPPVIWGVMAASYGLFFGGLILGTGHDGRAMFMIVISILYTLMYFGTAFALNSLRRGSSREKSQWIKGRFDTLTGPMSFGSVFGQMLIVPMMFAAFGLAIAVIRFTVM